MKFKPDTFRYSVCPKCGSSEIEADDFEYDDTWGSKEFVCLDCDFSWYEIYNFSHHEDKDGFRLDKEGNRVKINIAEIGED